MKWPLPSSEDSTCFEMIDLRQGAGIPAPTAITPPTKTKQHHRKAFSITILLR